MYTSVQQIFPPFSIFFQEQEETQPIIDNQDQPTVDAQQDEENDRLCILCLENERNAVLIPCGHAKFCNDCGQECMRTFTGPEPKCPLCRDPIAQCYRIYN